MINAGPPAVPTPLTTPVSEPTETTVTALELHVPPGTLFESVVAVLAQMVVVPVMVGGSGFTVTTSVTEHPATVYVRFAVPTVPPVITPVVAPTVIDPVPAEVVQVPPAKEFVAVTVAVVHTDSAPPIAEGIAFTVTVDTETQPTVLV